MLKLLHSGGARRFLSWALAALLCTSCVPVAAFAAEGEISCGTQGAAEGVSTEQAVSGVEEDDATLSDIDESNLRDVDAGMVEEAGSPTDSEKGDAPVLEPSSPAEGFSVNTPDAEAASATEETETVQKPDLGFVYVDEAVLVEGASQQVAVALSDESLELACATLVYRTLMASCETEASVMSGNAALFSFDNLDGGEYELVELRYSICGSEAEFVEELSGDGYCFTVEGEVSALEVSALAVNEDGSVGAADEAEAAIEEALEAPIMARAAAFSARTAAARSAASMGVTVALDPGHGGSDPGTSGYGLKEKDLTLKIANYCKAKLEASGISVFMTRTSDVYVGLEERVNKAVAAQADVFVSLHINSADAASAKGFEVWVPNNSSYAADTRDRAQQLGSKVVEQLSKLGLTNRGLKKGNSVSSKNPDGSTADSLSVIRNSRKAGVPGILIEHLFVSNANDAKLLADNAFLKKMGEADAQGIIEAVNGGIIKGKGGLYSSNGNYRFKNANGVDVVNCWQKVNGHWYYFGSDGNAVKWSHWIGGKLYYFNGSCQMQTGWITWNADGLKSYFDASGAALLGWQKIGGTWYYFTPSTGKSVRWSQKINGDWYYFNGQSQMYTGLLTWSADGTKSYYDASGKRKDGFQKVGGATYYFYPSTGKSARWSQKIDGNWYYFNGAYQMQTGWVTWNADGTKSYFDGSGKALLGWQTIGGKKYYFYPSTGKSARWSQKIDGNWYYFNGQSQMHTGWLRWAADGLESYYDAQGRQEYGWHTWSGKKYYIDPSSGKTVRWSRNIDGHWYYFNYAGEMQTGWITWNADGLKSYFNGYGQAAIGWNRIGGSWYYFQPNGKSVRWSQTIAGKDYYFNGQGQMQTGWITWAATGYKSYYDDNGAMVKGVATIGGVQYDFGEDGIIRDQIMGGARSSLAALTNDFEAQLRALKKTYPTEAYASKGAPTVADFCRILYEEAEAEGVRPEVLYAQVMHETGWLQFGGDVKPEQCNFGGIGATGGGNPGNTFADVREGLRAQTQHLKAYASKDALKNACVDPRFQYVNRGCAPYVSDLAGKWASDKQYGVKLNKIIDRVTS